MKGFFGKIKDYCIKDTTRTILLVAILVALYIVLNLWMQTINLAQIDLTKDKLYTLTDQSKNIAKKIDTYDISILPYEDCCTVFLPKHPVTRPKLCDVLVEEEKLDVQGLVDEAVSTLEKLVGL